MTDLAAQFDEVIIGTERGLIDKLQVKFPNKTIVPLSRAAVCGNMKVNTLSKLAWSLDHEKYALELPEDVRSRAEVTMRRMLDLSGGWSPANAEEQQIENDGLKRSGCGCA